MILFIHGVPDTPHLWEPLISRLGLEAHTYRTPALPGFGTARPAGFSASKDDYAEWLIQEMSAQEGPVDLVGHDWGALLCLRAASLRPDLVRTWCVTNAVIDPQYSGHRTARLWATPLIGELVMLGMRDPDRLRKGLIAGGMPAELAQLEVPLVDREMRESILRLYRSAIGLRFSGHWVADLARLPRRGQLFWGETDPFVDVAVARRFSRQHDIPLHIEPGAGHWACYERAAEFASVLNRLWSGST